MAAVIYPLTEIEIETEKEIISLTETKRETEMFNKTETKYKRKSERTKLNSDWNENDFKTKMVTYNVKAGISVAAETDCLKIWRCVCFWKGTKTWCDCMTE